MTAAEELKRMVTPVIVNVQTEMGKLPAEIRKAQQALGGPYPFVILADPALSKVYGSYNHTSLKGQDYRTIFRDAKRAASADIRNKTFNTDLGAPKPKNDVVAAAEKEAPQPEAEEEEMVRLKNPEMKTWTSSQGTTLKAKLVGVIDKETFVLVTDAGVEIRVTEKQLSVESRIAAKKLAGIY